MMMTWRMSLWSMMIVAVQAQMRPQIPVHLAQGINNVTSMTDFIIGYIRKKPDGIHPVEEPLLFTETGSFRPGGPELIAGELVEEDFCTPRLVTVPIVPSGDNANAGVLLFPQCTQVLRCGGCCGHEALQCVATRFRRVVVKVMKASFQPGSDHFLFEGLVEHTLEEHTSCECQCRVQAYNCNPDKHIYNAESCVCQCLNHEQAISCGPKKVWSNSECDCVCPHIPNCLADQYFNFANCSCERYPTGGLINTPAPTVNPCQSFYCRPGWRPVATADGRCTCRIGSRRRRSRYD